jgi:metal-responsive CopG/Arc/MetJ family transcriptional regulator
MAKVMISIPDDLLERLDARVRANRESRSGLLQRLVEEDLKADAARQRQVVEELLDKVTVPGGMGGEAARLIREDRESH